MAVHEAPTAIAQPSSTEVSALAHRERGTIHYELGQYESAITEYRKAYELKADPAVLFDIAQSYRLLGAPDRALFFYKRYRSIHPEAPNRAEAEDRIAELERQGVVAGKEAPPPEPRTAPDVLATNAPPPRLELAASIAPTPPPGEAGSRRWPLWTAVGALVLTGAIVALLAASGRGETEVPRSDLGHAKLF